jgi:hypothetical protein
MTDYYSILLERANESLEEDVYNFQEIPDYIKTPEMCLYAVQRESYLLGYVPDDMKTRELFLIALQNCGEDLDLSFISNDMNTSELYLEVVKKFGCALEWIPDSQKNIELCLTAVKNHGLCLSMSQNIYKRMKSFKQPLVGRGLLDQRQIRYFKILLMC